MKRSSNKELFLAPKCNRSSHVSFRTVRELESSANGYELTSLQPLNFYGHPGSQYGQPYDAQLAYHVSGQNEGQGSLQRGQNGQYYHRGSNCEYSGSQYDEGQAAGYAAAAGVDESCQYGYEETCCQQPNKAVTNSNESSGNATESSSIAEDHA